MKIEELKMVTTQKELFNKSEVMNINRLGVYEQYIQKYINKNGCYGVEPYYMDTTYIATTRNFRFRFIEIEFENDRVGVFFKYISMFGNVYVRLFREPVSINEIYENEKLVLDILYNNNLFKRVVVPHFYNFDKSKIKPFDDDYFNDVNERCNHITKGKFKSKHGINKLKNEYGISFKVNDFNKDDLNDLNNKWWETRKQTSKKDALFDGLIKLSKECDKIYILTWEYKGKPIAVTMLANRHNGYCCSIQVNKNLAKTKYINDEYLRSRLGKLVHYDTMLFCKQKGFKYAYISGALGEYTYLKKYKEANYKNVINYYVLDKDEFMQIYNDKSTL